MASPWLEKLKAARKTSLIQDGKRKIHYTFTDGTEMAEDYDMKSLELLVRKWKKTGTLGGVGSWEFEVGEQPSISAIPDEAGMVESSSNPIFVRKDTRKAFQWRIRNLPYPIEVYEVKANPEKRWILIRTSNKKYYKKFSIPDMDRSSLPLNQANISTAHAHNTLIITYEKPKEILEMEKQLQAELSKMKSSGDGDMECNPS